MKPSDHRKQVEAEIRRLCDETVADLTIKVDDDRWRATVAKCKALRKTIKKRKRLVENFHPYMAAVFGGKRRKRSKYELPEEVIE